MLMRMPYKGIWTEEGWQWRVKDAQYEESHGFYVTYNFIRVNKSIKLRLAVHTARMEHSRMVLKISAYKEWTDNISLADMG